MADSIERSSLPPFRIYFKEWRKSAGLTLQQVADKLGCSAGHLSRIENRKRDFNGRFLARFAVIVGCLNVTDLVVRTPAEPSLDAMFSALPEEQRLRLKTRAETALRALLQEEIDRLSDQ